MTATTREDCLALDATDPLAGLREQFDLPPDQIYLDGNSLGVLPRTTLARLRDVVVDEWGRDLIQSWNKAGWIDRPRRVGDKIARLIGAGPGEVIAADSTSLNLYKVLAVALDAVKASAPAGQAGQAGAGPARPRILSERDNFPTDLYIAASLADQHGFDLALVGHDEILDHLDNRATSARDGRVAVVMLTQVNYRTGRQHDLAGLTARAHAAGALIVWDLAHSAGAVPVDLNGADADFAVGCGYKFLNGGPGSPAFVWMHARHARRLDAAAASRPFAQPLSGWMGHAAPFRFTTGYEPARGIDRFLCGTPSALSLAALETGVDSVLAAEPLGGMSALRRKALALGDLFAALVAARCGPHGLTLQTPVDHARRGSQISFVRAEGGYAIIQALIARGVVGDYRDPGLLRFGLTPLYTRFVDVWDAVDHLAAVLDSGEWREPRFARLAAVT